MNDIFPHHVAVTVVGAGPVGLAVAAQLGQLGIDVCVVDKNPASLDIPRAIILDDEGARTLQSIGIFDRLKTKIVEGEGPLFYDSCGSLMAEIGNGTREFGFCKRHFIHQPDLESAIVDRLSEYAGVSIHFGAEVVDLVESADHVDISLCYQNQVHKVRSKVVLACDGANSYVRNKLGIAMVGHEYPDSWLIVDTENDPDISKNTKGFCNLDRPVMSIPAPNGGRRYEFKMLPGETRESVTQLDFVRQLLSPFRTLADDEITRIAVYNFKANVAQKLSLGRILLLGDAAHLTPPFAGQGMNAGLRDTSNVAWKVALVVQGKAVLGILNTYELERRLPIWAMINLATIMGDIIMPETKADSDLQSALFDKLDKLPGGREFLLGMKFKPRPKYSNGLFVDLNSPNVPASLVGCMIPQPSLSVNGVVGKLDDFIGLNFALIIQSEEMLLAAMPLLTEMQERFSAKIVCLVACDNSAPEVIAGDVVDSDIAFPFRAHRDQILLVRPDRYVGAAFTLNEIDSVCSQFSQLLQQDWLSVN